MSLLLALMGGGILIPSTRSARAADDVQPTPPLLFFSQPDEETRKDIDELIDNSFGDVSKVIPAREALVHRFGLWAVPPLVERLKSGANETVVRNSILTIAAIRRTYGPSQLLWPAIGPLVAVLKREGSDPWRRAFAALALGTFYGPETARRGGASHEGSEAGVAKAREALVEANAALVHALSDPNGPVAVAAALALGKIGGMAVSSAYVTERRTGTAPAVPEARVADLLCRGLLPTDQDVPLSEALRDGDRRVRAAAALGISCWAVAQGRPDDDTLTASAAAARALQLEAQLEPTRNTLIRIADWDGAEAVFARGALALLTSRMEPWEEIYTLATTTNEARASVAAAQALLFTPLQSPVRLKKIPDFVGRPNAGKAVREPVIASFLVVSGSDGSPAGVRACREYLRDKSREPRGKLEYDVRYYAAIALVRALVAGRVAPSALPDAVDALVEAWRVTLARGEGRTLRKTLEDVIKPFAKAFAVDASARPDPKSASLLEATFDDPDALLAHDPTDVAVHRLNDAVWVVFGLDALPRAVAGGAGGGPRQPSREDQELRFLLGWIERYPYYQRVDFLRDRGRIPVVPVPAGRDLDEEVDK